MPPEPTPPGTNPVAADDRLAAIRNATRRFADELSLTTMNLWIDEQRKVTDDTADWDGWVEKTYGADAVQPHRAKYKRIAK